MRIPEHLTPTTAERVRLPSGREEDLPKATPRFPEWRGEFPWNTYGGKPILDLRGEPLYAEFVILRLLEAEGWSGVWVNHVNRGPFPTRWTPSPVKIFPPPNLLDLMDRIYARSGKRSGAFDVLAWAGDGVLFAEAKHGGKDALRPSQKAWVEAALDEGVPLGSLLVVEWGFGGGTVEVNRTRAEAAVAQPVMDRAVGVPSPRGGISEKTPAERPASDTRSLSGSVTIDDGNASTSTKRVKLGLRANAPATGSGVVAMRIRNGGGPWSGWRGYAPKVDWELSEEEGQKSVYVEFKDRAGNKSEPAKATITLRRRLGAGGAGGFALRQRDLRADAAPSPPQEGVEIFFDAHDPDAHGKFLRWRERNRRGHVISRRSPTNATIHRAYCGHFEHGDKSASLTRTMKVCSRSKGELEGWARENIGAGLKRCRSCM